MQWGHFRKFSDDVCMKEAVAWENTTMEEDLGREVGVQPKVYPDVLARALHGYADMDISMDLTDMDTGFFHG